MEETTALLKKPFKQHEPAHASSSLSPCFSEPSGMTVTHHAKNRSESPKADQSAD